MSVNASNQKTNKRTVSALGFAEATFSLNQFNIASIFVLIAVDFNQSVSGLGLLSSSFFLGIGLSEVPGGILAARFGPRNLVVYGVLMSSVSVVATGLSPLFPAVVFLRFLAGLGNGFAFPSLLVLIVKSFRRGSEGFGTGMTGLFFSSGAIVGLFGWSVLAGITGWRISEYISGGLGIVSAISLFFTLPKETTRKGFQLKASDVRKILLDRSLVLLSLTFFGMAASSTLTWSFLVYYLETSLRLDPALAGLIGSFSLVFAFLPSPFVGRLYDRNRKAGMRLLVIAGTTMSVGVAVTALGTVLAAVLSSILVGLTIGIGATVGFSAARDVSGSNSEYQSLAVGWVDSVSLLGSFLSPLFFAALVTGSGYAAAWLVGSVFAVVFTLPILSYRKKVR